MANVAAVLKTEISRVARKEVRAEGAEIRKALAQQKAQIASLRKTVADLTKALAKLQKVANAHQVSIADAATDADDGDGVQRRFSPTRLLAHRQKLGMSVAQYAALVGVSSPTLRAWELGKRRPSDEQLKLVVAARATKHVGDAAQA